MSTASSTDNPHRCATAHTERPSLRRRKILEAPRRWLGRTLPARPEFWTIGGRGVGRRTLPTVLPKLSPPVPSIMTTLERLIRRVGEAIAAVLSGDAIASWN
eukprot:m.32851 g.32851  ORF g.32851 m.32851 type:complete len:102 (-) comp7111_c0_seq1:239-544(-)